MDHFIETLEARRLLSGHALTVHVHVGAHNPHPHRHHHDHFSLVVEVGSVFRESHKPSALFSQVFPSRPFVILEFGQIEPFGFGQFGTFGFGQIGTFDPLFQPFGFGQLPTFNEPGGFFFGFSSDPM